MKGAEQLSRISGSVISLSKISLQDFRLPLEYEFLHGDGEILLGEGEGEDELEREPLLEEGELEIDHEPPLEGREGILWSQAMVTEHMASAHWCMT